MTAPTAPTAPATAPCVVIAGLSARAAAESAARAGFRVVAVDAFGDLDLARSATVVRVPGAGARRYEAGAAARAADPVRADAAAYVGGFENHPAAVERLGAGRALWGNPAAVLRRVRDPLGLVRSLALRGCPVPAVRAAAAARGAARVGAGGVGEVRAGEWGAGAPPQLHDAPERGVWQHRSGAPDIDSTPSVWLVKRRASGGGRGVAAWGAGDPVPRGAVLQERIDGVPGSVAFVADGHRAVPFALSRQLVGEAAFGATGFVYCGSILAPAGDAQFARDAALYAAAVRLAEAVVDAFGLVGANGVDFVARDGVPFPVEVNPRYSASMELAERAFGFGVFAAHARACGGGSAGDAAAPGGAQPRVPAPAEALTGAPSREPARALPAIDLAALRRGAPAVGKAVVYARRAVTMGETGGWLDDPTVADVPHPGERIGAGRPICTVFAQARDAVGCHAALVRRAGRVYDAVEGGR